MVAKGQEEEQAGVHEHHEVPPSPPETPSTTVKRDAKGYALPSTKKTDENNFYATVNITQKRMSQKKRNETGGTKDIAKTVEPQSPPPPSPPPPSPPPPVDPALVDDDIKHEPSVPPRLPQSEELVDPDKNEPPYAKVNKNRNTESDQPPPTAETDDEEIDPYAAVDIEVLRGDNVPQMQITTDREYDTIDNVMSPPPTHNPVNIMLSELEGDYACVRSDATISPLSGHQRVDPGTAAVTTAHDTQTPANTTAHRQMPNDERTATSSPEESTTL